MSSSCNNLELSNGGLTTQCRPGKASNTTRNDALSASSTHSVQATSTTPRPDLLPMSASTHTPSSASMTAPSGRGLARHKRKSWMRTSVVRRAATVVDEEVAHLCEKSPFLNSLSNDNHNTTNNNNNDEIALFHRREIQLGKPLGRGGFAEVYEVAGFNIDSDEEDEDDDDDAEAKRRRACAASVVSSTTGRANYAIKFIRKKLLNNTREFQHAAIDLAVETKYLAALSHKHIISVRGLTRGGTGAFKTGKHDDFFLIMDHLQETLEHRLKRWQQRHQHNDNGDSDQPGSARINPPQRYYHRALQYALQISDALTYIHDKAIVYRDLKPSNLGFRERDNIVLFDFGLCRELPKPKGQAAHDDDMEDEEMFHMSGVGTQRYMAPEILKDRRYNLKADVYSLSMVALEMMTWNKPFLEYSPEEHTKFVAKQGQRPKLVMDWSDYTIESSNDCGDDDVALECSDESEKQQSPQQHQPPKRLKPVLVSDWPVGMAALLQEAWTQDVAERLTMLSVFDRLRSIVEQFDSGSDAAMAKEVPRDSVTQGYIDEDYDQNNHRTMECDAVVLEFPSHFSPRHQLSARSRHQQYQEQQQQPSSSSQPTHNHHPTQASSTRDDSEDRWFCGDRQSDASSSMQELTMTSASTTLHDSNSTNTN